jgi:hypothetical protein
MQFKAELDKDDYNFSGCYIMTCDLEQKESKQIETVDGQLTLYTPQKYNNNHRTAHPNVGTVVQVIGNCDFNVGDQLLCKHFAFEKENKTSNHFFEQDGIKYYKVYNAEIMFKVDGEELIPREGIVLSEPIYDKLTSTFLDLAGNLEDYRRDVAKVLKVWIGCTDYKPGDYIFLEKGGDYHFNFNGTDYVKSDDYFDDIAAVVDSKDWRAEELLIHQRDHSTVTDKTT